jgi:hypothetical protein
MDAQTRLAIARDHEAAMNSEGWVDCRVWVGGPGNTKVIILDPEARMKFNDYNGVPVFWWQNGFDEVLYLVNSNEVCTTIAGRAPTAHRLTRACSRRAGWARGPAWAAPSGGAAKERRGVWARAR